MDNQSAVNTLEPSNSEEQHKSGQMEPELKVEQNLDHEAAAGVNEHEEVGQAVEIRKPAEIVMCNSVNGDPNQDLNMAEGVSEHEIAGQAQAIRNPADIVMRNQLVLERIAKELPHKNMLSLRETCTRWNESFLPELKKNHKPIEVQPKSDRNHPRSIERFSQLMQESNGIEFARLKFDTTCACPSKPFVTTPNRMFNFVSEFGSSITSLDLASITSDVVTIPELYKLVFQLTPNLSELRLVNMCGGEDDDEKQINEIRPISLRSLPSLKRLATGSESSLFGELNPAFAALVAAILHSAPNLESLNLRDLDTTSGDGYIPSTLAALQSSTAMKNLKDLKIFELVLVNLKALVEMGKKKNDPLRLQQFSGFLFAPVNENREPGDEFRECVQLLHKFLATQAATLKYLNLTLHYDGVDLEQLDPWQIPHFRIPRLENLIKFDLNILNLSPCIKIQYDGSDVDVEGMNRLEGTFPHLRKIYYCSNLDEDYLNRREISHFAISSLELCTAGYLLLGEVFELLPDRYPAVTRLKTDKTRLWGGGAEILNKIWILWPNLTHLNVHVLISNEMTPDGFLTGVAEKDFQDLQLELDSMPRPVSRDALGHILCRDKVTPGVINLRHLKLLKLVFETPYNSETEARLTDLGGYFGLGLASRSLQVLEIKGCWPKSSISEECLAFIRSQVLKPTL